MKNIKSTKLKQEKLKVILINTPTPEESKRKIKNISKNISSIFSNNVRREL